MKRILVGLDGSPRATHVLEVATGIARSQAAKLLLVRSVGLPPDLPQDFWKTTEAPLLEVLTKRAQAYLDECAAKVPAELLEKTMVLVGVPWHSICETARRESISLIVVGSHGYTGLDHLVGTTAAKVVDHARCSVLVVRQAPAS